MEFKDLTEYLDAEPLRLPVKGKTYTVPPASAELGLWCRATYSAAQADTDEEESAAVAQIPQLRGDKTLAQTVLGSAYEEMRRDGLEDVYVEFCAAVTYLWIVGGEEAAQTYWQAGGDPNAVRPANRADRRARRTGASSTAGDSGTPSPAPSSGTRSRRRSGNRNRNR